MTMRSKEKIDNLCVDYDNTCIEENNTVRKLMSSRFVKATRIYS